MRVFHLLLIILFTSCTPKVLDNSKNTVTTSQDEYLETIYQVNHKLFNSNKDFVIISNKSLDNKSDSSFEFQIIDLTNRKSIYKDFVNQGKVKWIDKHIIQVDWTPGEIEDENYHTSYTYNINNQMKKFK